MEADLVEQAAAGEEQALERLIVDHLPELRGFVDRRLGHAARAREAVSDVVQSTCRELLTHRERFRFGQGEGFRRWLFATAMRKLLDKDRLHTAERRDVRREDAAPEHEAPDARATPSEVADGREAVDLLAAAVERLPADQREVVLLSHLAGLSRQEVARAMGRTEASVRNLLHRAVVRLGADMGRSSG